MNPRTSAILLAKPARIVASVTLAAAVALAVGGCSSGSSAEPVAPNATQTTAPAPATPSGSYTETVTGDYQPENNISTYDSTNSQVGRGTGTLNLKNGVYTAMTRFADGTMKSTGTYTLTRNTTGPDTFTGSGHCVAGSGVFATANCTYTFEGTTTEATGGLRYTVTGTYN